MHLPHLVRRLLAVASLSALTLGACGERAATAALPWTMAVDSTGDTIRVRITGDVPDSLVRTLEVDLAIGETDGADELTFGRIGGIVVGRDGAMFVHDADQTVGLVRLFDQGQSCPVRPQPGILLQKSFLGQIEKRRNFRDFRGAYLHIPGPPAASRAALALPESMWGRNLGNH